MKTRWYKDAVIYQIYPRSFCDSNGDGIGDIQGIISKLDYLKDLGIDAVWLSPVYKSPNEDNGYDISDYRDINPEFGTMADFDEMLKGLHERGIRLVMDLVVNHTSSQHEWFQESRKSKDNPYRDYYIWRKGTGKDGKKAPNNWTSCFTGPAWKYDETTDEFYLHIWSEGQPDLNWDNPKVRQEAVDICNFWFEKGVDGFRCDVITTISKREGLPNGKKRVALTGSEHYVVGPHCHEYLNQLNTEAWSKYDTMIVGEAFGTTFAQSESLIGEERNELDTIFNFEHMEVDMLSQFFPVKFKLPKFKSVMDKWQSLPSNCWNSLYLENHDQPRCLPRYCKNLNYRYEGATMLATMLFLQKGTPYIYQGQEIGMTNCKFKKDEYIDIMATRIFGLFRKYLFPVQFLATYAMSRRARDHARTPMQWNGGVGAGFTSGSPWMKINPNYTQINVDKDQESEKSILSFYKRLLSFRKGDDILINGGFKDYDIKNKNFYIYERSGEKQRYLIVCSFSDKDKRFLIPPNLQFETSELVLSNYPDGSQVLSDDNYRPYEARVYLLS